MINTSASVFRMGRSRLILTTHLIRHANGDSSSYWPSSSELVSQRMTGICGMIRLFQVPHQSRAACDLSLRFGGRMRLCLLLLLLASVAAAQESPKPESKAY